MSQAAEICNVSVVMKVFFA